ncbi:anti-sigma factor family protein [Paenibacillus chartarius]|uniref:Anti-sigma factor family protein n=1 Tax=Paenibacillus chartarius TaxID=747481 RepID=A0ABV6DQC9_9BACL
MMKCSDIQDLFGQYWDIPNDDLRRQAVDKHVEHCPACAEEFQFWKETSELIRFAATDEVPEEPYPISRKVMDRIYKDESWRVPITERMYAISYRMRRNVTAVISFCLALFIVSFLFSVVYEGQTVLQTAESPTFGLQAPQVISASAKASSMDGHMMTAVASIGQPMVEPLKYQVGPMDSYSHYLLVVSLLGITCTILIMNWFSRTKA